MTAELEIRTKLATEMAADAHAALSKYADNKDITLGTTLMAMVWLTSDMLAHVLLNNPEELREPLVGTVQGMIQLCTEVSLGKGERCGIQECLETIGRKLKEKDAENEQTRRSIKREATARRLGLKVEAADE